MKLTKYQARFARALFEQADHAGEARGVLEELKAVWVVLSVEPDLQKTLGHPKVPRAQREALLAKVLGDTVSQRTRDFLSLVARRAQIARLDGIIALYEALLLEREGIVRAHVTTAVPVDDGEKKMIVKRLKQISKMKVEATYEVDRAIVGGIVIRLGDRLIDGSVRFHLQRMSDELKSLRLS